MLLMRENKMQQIVRNVLWGLALAFGMFVFLAGLAGVVRLVAGPDRWYEGPQMTYTQFLGIYASTALAGGILLGLMRPLTRFRWGSILTGVFIAFIFYWIGSSTAMGDWSFNPGKVIICMFAAIVTGAYLGVSSWNDEYGRCSKRALRREEEEDPNESGSEDRFGWQVEEERQARR
jgi:hypothetical protein